MARTVSYANYEQRFDAMGNKIEGTKRKVKLSSSELRKKYVKVRSYIACTPTDSMPRKKDRMMRRKKGEEVFTDEDE